MKKSTKTDDNRGLYKRKGGKMIKVIIKTILIIVSIMFLLSSAKDFNNKDKDCYGYIAWIFIMLIVIIVLL